MQSYPQDWITDTDRQPESMSVVRMFHSSTVLTSVAQRHSSSINTHRLNKICNEDDSDKILTATLLFLSPLKNLVLSNQVNKLSIPRTSTLWLVPWGTLPGSDCDRKDMSSHRISLVASLEIWIYSLVTEKDPYIRFRGTRILESVNLSMIPALPSDHGCKTQGFHKALVYRCSTGVHIVMQVCSRNSRT
jgi:hypothetical protein